MKQDIEGLERFERARRPAEPDRQILEIIPATAGPRLTTLMGGAIHLVRPPGSQTVQAVVHFAAVMLAPAPGNRSALGSDRLIEYDAPVGALVVHPANVEGRAIWSYPRESLIVAIRPESLLELAASELDTGSVSLQPPPFGTIDPEALKIAELLKLELTRPYPATELYVDSLVTIFGLHLLRNYSGAKKPASDNRHGLSVHNAKRIRTFLNENFLRKLSIAELAAVAEYSPFHFIRAFSKTFGQSPHQYVLNLRLAFAEKLLVEGNLPVAEIAHLSGFSSQSHLTAMMKKYRHTTPAKMRSRR